MLDGFSRHASVLLIGLFALTIVAQARDPGIGVAQPTNYVSPSGAYSLFVDPLNRYGDGGARYRFSHNGAELYSYEKPYSLCEVTVTDVGLATGMAYRQERGLEDRDSAEQFLHLVILAQDGREILNEETKRRSGMIHGPTLPKVEQLLVNSDQDRFLVRVQGRSEELWTYRLSNGESVSKVDLREKMAGVHGFYDIIDSRMVRGTPFVLLHWLTKDPDRNVRDYGAVFSLIDVLGNNIWNLKAHNDYANVDLNWVRGLGPRFFDREPVIVTGDNGRFDIRLFGENKQVAFEVRPGDEGKWNVVELGRINVPEAKITKTPPTTSDAYAASLNYLGELELKRERTIESPIRGLWDFTFDSKGIIHVIRRTKQDSSSIGTLDAEGNITQERSLPSSNLIRGGRYWLDTSLRKDDQYIQLRDQGDSHSAWLVSLQTGQETPLTNFPDTRPSAVARLGEGGLVVLDTYDQSYSPADRLRCFDSDGKLRWEMRSDVAKDYEILGLGPSFVAVTTNDNLVLLNIDSLDILDREGKHLKKIDLTGAFGSTEFGGSPGYLHEVVADTDGGFLVADFRNPPVVLRYKADGTLRSRWSPRHPDGKTFDLQPQIRVAPDGRLWTGDGNSLMRLTDDGVVDQVIGHKHSPDELTAIAAFTVDTRGNYYAVDERSSSIHVFEPGGDRIQTIKPNPSEVQGTVKDSFLAVNNHGEIYLRKPATQTFMPPDEYLKFSASGEALGTVTFQPSMPISEFFSLGWSFQPKTNYRCGVCSIRGDTRLVLVDPPATVIREQRRRPDGRWFGHWTVSAVAPDGSIAVLDSDNLGKGASFELSLFTDKGDPIKTIKLPASQDRYSGLAYDGARAVVFGRSDAILLDLATGAIERRPLVPPGVTDTMWTAFFVPHSNEILLFDRRKHKIHRYGLPDRNAQALPKQDDFEADNAKAVESEEAKAEWVQRLEAELAALPLREPCIVYIEKIPGGERTMSEEQASQLPQDERAKLRTMRLDDCGISLDDPRVMTRILAIAAANGVPEITNRRILDVGCCDLRVVQQLARMGAQVVQTMAGFSLAAMCNDWHVIEDLRGAAGHAGHLEVLRPGQLSLEALTQANNGGFDLVVVRNVLADPLKDDYFSMPAWIQAGFGTEKEAFAKPMNSVLRPGGLLLIYNVGVETAVTKTAIPREMWEKTGFEIIQFDKDDRMAATTIGMELGWDKHHSSLKESLHANYSVLKKAP